MFQLINNYIINLIYHINPSHFTFFLLALSGFNFLPIKIAKIKLWSSLQNPILITIISTND